MNAKLASRERRFSARGVALVAHRYAGLMMAAFLVLAGLTGAVIAFYEQIDAVLNPDLFRAAPPAQGAPLLDPFTLRERVQRQLPPGKELPGVVLHLEPGRAVHYWFDEQQAFVDPYSGKILGSRRWGDLSEGKKNLLPFIYRLHFSLALGDVGTLIFGVVALLWTIDCFVGAYLTFPLPARGQARATPRAWLGRWLPAWLIKTNKLFALVFTWHRASGLWLWMMFFVFAWSAVALNLRDAYEPVMLLFFGEPEHAEQELPELDSPRRNPKLGLREAHAVARRLMAEEAEKRGFQVIGERSLDHLPEHGVYSYMVESTLDISERLGETTVVFDSDDGSLRDFSAWTGQGAASTVTSWLIALHFGAWREGGIVYRAFVCAMGIVVTLLSVTGVWIWWKKRRPRSGRVVG